MSPRRPGTNADQRELLVRKDTPPRGVEAPVFVDPSEEKTDVHNAGMRALDEVRELRADFRAIDGKLDRVAEGQAKLDGKIDIVLGDRTRRQQFRGSALLGLLSTVTALVVAAIALLRSC